LLVKLILAVEVVLAAAPVALGMVVLAVQA
jgi:hypothetical protein